MIILKVSLKDQFTTPLQNLNSNMIILKGTIRRFYIAVRCLFKFQYDNT